MEDIRVQQKEALETAMDYSVRLENAIKVIVKELRNEKLEDTQAYLDEIVNGFNWVIEVMNGTMSLLQESPNALNKDEINQKVLTFGQALKAQNDNLIADALENEVLATIKIFHQNATEALAN